MFKTAKYTQPTIPLYPNDGIRLNDFMEEDETGKTQAKKTQTSFNDLLLAIAEKQDRDAFIRIFEYFAPRIKSFLMKSGLTPETADELAQETMLTIWNKATSYNPEKAAASTWIFTIARNKKIDFFRQSGKPPLNAEDLLLTSQISEPSDDQMTRKEEETTLTGAIKNLPEEQAALIRKSFFEDKTHNEIAQETGIPLGTVKSRIRLALKRLRHHLGGYER